MFIIFAIVLIIVLVIFLFIWCKFVKIPKLNAVNFICGTNGSGKSFFSMRLGIGCRSRIWFQNFRRKLVYYNLIFIPKLKERICSEEDIEIYCDIPLDLHSFHIRHFDLNESLKQKKKIYHKVDYALRIEKAHILREKRFNYKSIIIFDELSILIDQFDFDDKIINDRLVLFFKLFRHETKGGICIINSQSTNDLHFSVKNVLNQIFYLHHKKKLLFGVLLYVQELSYSNDNNVINVNQGDLECDLKLKRIWVSKKYFKCYDSYAHSWLTDYCTMVNLPYSNDFIMKSRNIWTLKNMSSLFDNVPIDELLPEQKDFIDISNVYKAAYTNRKYKDFEKLKKEVVLNDKKVS